MTDHSSDVAVSETVDQSIYTMPHAGAPVVVRGDLAPLVEAPGDADLSGWTLDQLARVAVEENRLVDEAAEAAEDAAAQILWAGMSHVLRAGEVLWEARQRFPERTVSGEGGGWVEWATDNLDFAITTMNRHIRVFRCRDILLAADPSPTSLNSAIGLLVGHWGRKRTQTHDLDEIRRLSASGMNGNAIAELMGCSKSLVSVTLNPEQAKARRARQALAVKNRAPARAALAKQQKREEHDAQAKTGTAEQEKIYNLIRNASTRAGIEGLVDLSRTLMKAEQQILEAIDRSEHGR